MSGLTPGIFGNYDWNTGQWSGGFSLGIGPQDVLGSDLSLSSAVTAGVTSTPETGTTFSLGTSITPGFSTTSEDPNDPTGTATSTTTRGHATVGISTPTSTFDPSLFGAIGPTNPNFSHPNNTQGLPSVVGANYNFRTGKTKVKNIFSPKKSSSPGTAIDWSGLDSNIESAAAAPTPGVTSNAGIGIFGESYPGDFESTPTSEADTSSGASSGASASSSAAGAAAPSSADYGQGDWGLPVVLDLNNNGADIVPLSQSTAHFDITGTGKRQVMAWIGADDALLVYDRDGDRMISHKDEIAFKNYLANARTDLEGLAWFDQLAQGGNEDGVLDERDAAWSKFGVWQDSDQDGETDDGELRMTGEGGLQSVNLSSDQQPIEAGPDARIFGRGSYEYLDDDGRVQKADLFDTALRYESGTTDVENFGRLDGHLNADLPPLIRLDGRVLSRGECCYPAMAYRENVHEVWPTWAIAKATELYPELPTWIAASQEIAKDRPEDLLDPDYYPRPENPIFLEACHHAKWKHKKSAQGNG